MLVINYNGNKPTTDYFKFSVQGNNKADTIRFLVSLNQSGLVFDENYHIYAKVQSVDDDYYDKVELSEVEFDDSRNLLKADFSLKAQQTSHKQIEVSLSCENLDSEVVWQTQLVKVAIANGVNADEEVADQYPSILQDLQAQIDELAKKEGGGASEVEIKRVWLSYDKEQKCVIRADYLGYYDNGDYKNYVNDSTKIFVNFETTPISTSMKNEIKNGRFVIRLDYPISNKGGVIRDLNSATHRTPTRDYGIGVRNYTRSFDQMNANKKACLLNSLIFIEEEDIKINRYGEEYILKQVSLFNFINNMVICKKRVGGIRLQLDPLTLEEVNDDTSGCYLFNDYLEDAFCIGIPSLNENTSTHFFQKYRGFSQSKLYQGNHSRSSMDNFTNSKKFNPAFNIYTPLKLEYYYDGDVVIYSPYFNSKGHKKSIYGLGETTYYIRKDVMGYPLHKRAKLTYMVAKPRCAILNDDYETSDYAFLRNYPQSTQQIKLSCKVMKNIDDYEYSLLPIFRMMITPK